MVLLKSLFQLISYIIQERLVKIMEGSNILCRDRGGSESFTVWHTVVKRKAEEKAGKEKGFWRCRIRV